MSKPYTVHQSIISLFQASKDKSGKFNENFNVTLFLVRPNDQILQEEFSRSNIICQVMKNPVEVNLLNVSMFAERSGGNGSM